MESMSKFDMAGRMLVWPSLLFTTLLLLEFTTGHVFDQLPKSIWIDVVLTAMLIVVVVFTLLMLVAMIRGATKNSKILWSLVFVMVAPLAALLFFWIERDTLRDRRM